MVRDIELWNLSGSEDNADILVHLPGLSGQQAIWVTPPMAQGAWAQWQGRTVLYANQVIRGLTGIGNWECLISGYQFQA